MLKCILLFMITEQYSNFMSIQQLRIKQMALYWLFWGGSRSLVMLCLKFVEVRYHRECLKSLSESLFVLNCQRIHEIICGIFRTIQFQMLFMTSCLTTYRLLNAKFLCYGSWPIFLDIYWYTVVPKRQTLNWLYSCIFTNFRDFYF